jgi:hypothetical protein
MAEPFTRDEFTAAIKAAVDERGRDFVYPNEWKDTDNSCVYSLEDGTPACIIGAALDKLGVKVGCYEQKLGAYQLFKGMGVKDADLLDAVEDAQLMQDSEATWGEALDMYLEIIGEDENK